MSIARFFILGAVCLFAICPLNAAEKRVSSREELQAALSGTRPGDTILIAPGIYAGGIFAKNLRGTAEAPIIIAGQDTKNPPIFRGGAQAFQLSSPVYVEIRSLAIDGMTGNGINIDDGSNAESSAQHIILQGLTIRDIGPGGNNDGIKLSGVTHFQVLNCEITDWGAKGSGIDMVGCHRGLIVGNTFTHKESTHNNAVQTKGGSTHITIERNFFNNAGSRAVNIGGSTGLQFFRPPLKPGEPIAEAGEIIVQGNRFEGSQAPIAFVGVDRAIVRFNTIINPGRWAIRILQESKAPDFVPCRFGEFTDNIVVFTSQNWASGGVNIGGETAPGTFKFARNWWYCADQPDRSRPTLPVEESDGVYGIAPRLDSDKPAEGKAGAAAFKQAK